MPSDREARLAEKPGFGNGLRWLLALALLVNVIGLGSHRVLTDHEALLAGNVKQMVQSGDWLVPRIGDRTWVEKPPLPQWLAATSALLLGRFDEWSMRLPFALTGIVVVLLIVQIMSQLFGPRVGLLSGFVQATVVYQVMYSRLAEADVVLQAFVLAAIAVFVSGETDWDSLSARQRTQLRLAWWVLLGAMNLVKGIAFGAVLTLLTCAGWYLLRGDGWGWRRWWSPLGMLLAAAIAAAWPLAVAVQEPAAVALWQQHFFGRAAGTLGYTQPWWYYLTTWPTQLLPWLPFLFVALPQVTRAVRQDRTSPEAFCLWWSLSQIGLLSCSSGKHHHYLIYALPALTPLMVQGLTRCGDWLHDPARNWLEITRLLQATGVALALTAVVSISWWQVPYNDALLIAVALCGSCWWLAAMWQQRRPQAALSALLTLVTCGHVVAQLEVMPRRDPSVADRQFLREVEQLVPANAPLAACGSQEIARHLFYVSRSVAGIWNIADVPAALPGSPEIYVIARGAAREELSQWGTVERVAQSSFTRRERTPNDRYTLFLVRRSVVVAEKSTLNSQK